MSWYSLSTTTSLGMVHQCQQQTLELFQGMVERGLKKKWFCQASINVADNLEVLEWAGRAGCRMIFLGIEAEDDYALNEVNKRLNLKHGTSTYEETFDRIHSAGIAVLGAFIFGMDGDTPEKLRRTNRLYDQQWRGRHAGHCHDSAARHAVVSTLGARRATTVHRLSTRLGAVRSDRFGSSADRTWTASNFGM